MRTAMHEERRTGYQTAKPAGHVAHAHTILFIDNAPLLSQLIADCAALSDPQCRAVVTDSLVAAEGALEDGMEPCLIAVGGQFTEQQVCAFLAAKGRTAKAAVPLVLIRAEGDAPIGRDFGPQVTVLSPGEKLRFSMFCAK